MLKHSKATEIRIDIAADGMLQIKIHDNGVGIDLQNIRQFGNGLQNIDRRMKSIGGNFQIEKSNGTETILTLPLWSTLSKNANQKTKPADDET